MKANRVLLVYSRISGPDPMPWIPIGLLYIAAVLEQHNIDVMIYDRNKHDGTLCDVIESFHPDLIGIGAMTVQAEDALNISAEIKADYPDITVCLGGVHFTFRPEEGLTKGAADIVVLGEGEYAMRDICLGKPLDSIPGVVFKDLTGKVIRSAERQFIKDLDELPLPAYHLVDVMSYDDHLITGEKAISLLTGRGCPMACTFCASPELWQRRIRLNSISYAIKHIKFLVDRYGVTNIRIMDDTFTVSRRRVLEFCEQVKPFGLNMTCLTNVRNSDFEMLKIMKESGFSIVAYGVECANQRVLDNVSKGITLSRAIDAILNAQKAGLLVELLFMIGNVTETEDTIIDSIAFARKYNPDGKNWFQFSTPFPGSAFSVHAEEYGDIISWDLNDWDHQRPVFIPHGLNEEVMIGLRHLALNGGSLIRDVAKEKVFVFGTGGYLEQYKGEIFSRFHVLSYLDNSIDKQGRLLYGKPIESPDTISTKENVKVVIASTYKDEIHRQLTSMGVAQHNIYYASDFGVTPVGLVS